MGLLQQAVKTYDELERHNRVGKANNGGVPLAPISHMITRADLEITLDMEGNYVSSRLVDKSDPKIIIPVTEKSAGRAGIKPFPHPLCDQLWYIASYNENKHKLYIEQLEQWASSQYTHPKLTPILTYVKHGTILKDLENAGIIELNDKGQPKNEKMLVCWRVQNSGEDEACWSDPSLFQSFIDYYDSLFIDEKKNFCMITGKSARAAIQHPKGIVALNGNAKLISSNDTSGFTYLGRFTEADQVVEISYEASQKAHSALRWLIANYGVSIGGRTFVCWNPTLREIASPFYSLVKDLEIAVEPEDYKKQLQDTLNGWQTSLKPNDRTVFAAFDAATSGRLALTYYNELQESDFLQRLFDWDEKCCWYNNQFGIQSPALRQIVNCAFGTQQGDRLKTDDRVMGGQVQRLLACRIDQAKMPADIMRALVHRASMPQAYDNKIWRQILFVACAVVRKYRYDLGEEWSMSLDVDKLDRSYQFGRLLAVMEKIEKDNDKERETNAIRLLSVYTRRPYQTFKVIYERIRVPYLSKLPYGLQTNYQKLLEEIMAHISALGLSDEDLNRPLKETYLMGYYLQQNELYKSKSEKMEEENDD